MSRESLAELQQTDFPTGRVLATPNGIRLDRVWPVTNAIEVNTDDYSTNVEGVYAIGDINTYKNKLKLILCGFHEAALMSHSAYRYINPGVKYTMKYTTVNGVNSF